MGGDLKTLHRLLQTHFCPIFPGGIHLLPPFPSSGDRGFAPRTYFEIEPRFGTWEDIRRIGEHFPVMVDLMANHISRQSPYFQDFTRRGRRSPYAGLFLTLEKVWPGGSPPPEEVAKIFLRRPEQPFVDIPIQETGEVERVWATFGTRDWSEQIDLDVQSPATRQLFTEILAHFGRNGVKGVRLDAVAYVIKKPGTSCFFVEPDLYAFMEWIQAEAQALGLEVLPEVHAEFGLQVRLAAHGYQVYNFVLPLLILHTLLNRSSRALQAHLQVCTRRQITMLDCHDGIPVQPDINGILEVEDAQRIVHLLLARGANLSRILSDAHKLRPDYDAHQINCTYYSALGGEDNAYLAARSIQFFTPGTPQVYYVGLLAGENDPEAITRTGERRAINRHDYSAAEVEAALEKPVVQRLLALIRFRNENPAFQGNFRVLPGDDRRLRLRWESGVHFCELDVNLDTWESKISYREGEGPVQEYRP